MDWKEIYGYKFRYRINEEGTVQKNCENGWEPIVAQLKSNKRAYVRLRKETGEREFVAVVDLMDKYFFGGYARENGLKIVHKNGSRADCSKKNLIFMTNSEIGKIFGAKSGRSPVIISDPDGSTTFCKSIKEASKKSGLTLYSLSRILKGELLDPKGRTIRYADEVI